MSDSPWLTIIGLGEDGPDGLPPASRAALEGAEVIMGPPRHLALLPEGDAERIAWPVPFADGWPILQGLAGRQVVVLASGDPFWFGVGRGIAERFEVSEWRTLPGPSTFSLVASRLGWPLEETICLGLHAAPLPKLRRYLAPGQHMIVLLRDGPAVSALAAYLASTGFGGSTLHICEAIGGPRERVTRVSVAEARKGGFTHPVCAAVEVTGTGPAVPLAPGLPDDMFDTDGVMTKRGVRALTVSALAPRPGEHLWDIGGGSGSIAVEWCLAHPTCRASTVEPRKDRVALIRANAAAFGVDLDLVEGVAPEALNGLDRPDVVFVGGGLTQELLDDLIARLMPGTRLVANAVTLETEMILTAAQDQWGGELLRIELSRAAPMAAKRGWQSAYPVVQWSVTL